MKGITVAILLVIGSLFAFSTINAEESTWYSPGSLSNRPMEYKNLRQGYLLFRSNCKTCHTRDNDKDAPFLCSDSKTMKGWNRVFARENAAAEKQGCLKDLSKEELMDLNDYLYTHAIDAKNPHDDLECNL